MTNLKRQRELRYNLSPMELGWAHQNPKGLGQVNVLHYVTGEARALVSLQKGASFLQDGERIMWGCRNGTSIAHCPKTNICGRHRFPMIHSF